MTTIRPGQQATVGGRLLFEKGDAKLEPETTRNRRDRQDHSRASKCRPRERPHLRDEFPDNVSADKQMDLSIRRANSLRIVSPAWGLSRRFYGCRDARFSSRFDSALQPRVAVE